jgi:hypothetical protein
MIESNSPSPRTSKKTFDFFNNNFKENKAIKSIKKKKDLKIFDFDLNDYLAEEKKISSSIFNKEESSNNDIASSFNRAQVNRNKHQASDLIYKDISKIRGNDLSSNNYSEKYYKESTPNKAINDKFLKFKFKWKKDEREKKLKEFRNNNSRYFNNVILLRPEIIQSQKQTQFDIFTSKVNKKNNIGYVNYILRKANKNTEEKFMHVKEIDQKVERFANKMEQLEKDRFNNFRNFNELNNIHITKNIESQKAFSEDNFKEQGSFNANKIFYDENEKMKFGNSLNNKKSYEESVIANKNSTQIVSSNSSSAQKKLTICGYFLRIYRNVKGFLINDPNKSFAEKKIIWVGKNGAFPIEFQDNRKVD